jgi:hypothetical protein
VTTASCDAAGGECVFVAVSASDTVHEHGDPGAVECVDAALRGEIDPPYRAVAHRREGAVWAVGAVEIEIAALPIGGDELEFVVGEDGSRTLTVDGHSEIVGIDALEAVAAGRFSAYVLRAQKLRDGLWEVQTDPI